MSAVRKLQPCEPPADEMARLNAAGFSLIPLGRGDDGKAPLTAFSGSGRMKLGQVLGPMHKHASACYGIRLDGLAVLDLDHDDPELVNDLEARFGASPVHVKTPRGRHLYYRAGEQFPNLRAEGLPVDIKRGANSYVMGPHSVRPDSGQYIPLRGLLGIDPLPVISGHVEQRAATVKEGSRNYSMTVLAREMVEMVEGLPELVANLQYERDERCENPDTLPDIEIQKIAEWAWRLRLENRLFSGRSSEFRLDRRALDVLKGYPNASDAIALYTILLDQHGHKPEREIYLDHCAMRAAGHTDLSRRRFLEARRSIEDAGLLVVAGKHRAGQCRRSYKLKRPRPQLPDDVADLASRGAGKKGRGV